MHALREYTGVVEFLTNFFQMAEGFVGEFYFSRVEIMSGRHHASILLMWKHTCTEFVPCAAPERTVSGGDGRFEADYYYYNLLKVPDLKLHR